jgi:hypothetical protein
MNGFETVSPTVISACQSDKLSSTAAFVSVVMCDDLSCQTAEQGDGSRREGRWLSRKREPTEYAMSEGYAMSLRAVYILSTADKGSPGCPP